MAADGPSAHDISPPNESEHLLLTSDDDNLDRSEHHPDSADPDFYPGAPRRQSSFAQPRLDGAPRTPNRVRFDLEDIQMPQPNGSTGNPSWMDEDDYLEDGEGAEEGEGQQRVPLLTQIEAPSVRVAIDFDPEEHLESARPRSNMANAFMNMANSIIGAGIIGQPYALKQAGLISGVVLLVGLTVVVDWTIQLIVINSKMSGADSFQGTVEHCFGKPGMIAISVAQWAFAFGGMIAFCIIIGDTIPHVIKALFPSLENMSFLWLLTDRRAVIVIFILCISLPLSLYRDIAKLAKASTLALISMAVIIVTVVTQGPIADSSLKGPIRGSILINSGIIQAIGVISFAFVCHHNSLLIYGSLQKPTLDRFATVTHYSTSISCAACLLLGLAGFLSFGSLTQGNVLNNFSPNSLIVNIARLCFGLNMLTTLPLECFVAREVTMLYFWPTAPFNMTRHVALTAGFVVAALAVSLVTCDLGAVFELIGATSAAALAYVLPPLCYIKLAKRSWKTGLAIGTAGFGIVVMVISVILSVKKLVNHEGETKTCS